MSEPLDLDALEANLPLTGIEARALIERVRRAEGALRAIEVYAGGLDENDADYIWEKCYRVLGVEPL